MSRALVGLAGLALATASSACGGPTRTIHIDAPFYPSLEAVASQSTLVVEGEVTGRKGLVALDGENTAFANDVAEFRVTGIRGRAGAADVAVGDTLNVGMFAVSDQVEDVGNIESLREEVASYSSPLPEGVPLILFLSPFQFSPEAHGWVVSGGNYGVIEIGAVPFSRAPLGPLAGATIDGPTMTAALAALGSKPPPPRD